jgi:hypothetical protein
MFSKLIATKKRYALPTVSAKISETISRARSGSTPGTGQAEKGSQEQWREDERPLDGQESLAREDRSREEKIDGRQKTSV